MYGETGLPVLAYTSYRGGWGSAGVAATRGVVATARVSGAGAPFVGLATGTRERGTLGGATGGHTVRVGSIAAFRGFRAPGLPPALFPRRTIRIRSTGRARGGLAVSVFGPERTVERHQKGVSA